MSQKTVELGRFLSLRSRVDVHILHLKNFHDLKLLQIAKKKIFTGAGPP